MSVLTTAAVILNFVSSLIRFSTTLLIHEFLSGHLYVIDLLGLCTPIIMMLGRILPTSPQCPHITVGHGSLNPLRLLN